MSAPDDNASARRPLLAWAFLAPAFVLLAIFVVWPLVLALRLAFYEADGLTVTRFIGLQNFRDLFADPVMWKSFRNLLFYAALTVPLQTFGPLLGAKLVHSVRSPRSSYWLRTLLVVPVMVPGVVGLLTWQEIYSTGGLLNQLLQLAGLESWARAWLGDPATVIPALVAMGMPWTGGIFLLLYLAGFLAIPASLREAAELDGATRFQIFFRVELPMLSTQIKLMATLSLLGVVQSFEAMQILTNGGPINASLTPSLYLFRTGFEFGRLGYASALGLVLLAATALLAVGLWLASKSSGPIRVTTYYEGILL